MRYNTRKNTDYRPHKGEDMVAYSKKELVGSTELAKSLGGFIDKIVSRSVEKIVIVRHNKPEAVIVPIDEYERMKIISDYIEDMEIAQIIEERMPEGKEVKTTSLNDYLESRKRRGLHVSDRIA